MYVSIISYFLALLFIALAGFASAGGPSFVLVPESIVEGFLKNYSELEIKKIKKDYHNIHDLIFSGEPSKGFYVGTAGGPGASKTTILEAYLNDNPAFVYIDPDQRGLKFMINTYLLEINNYAISKSSCFQDLLKGAYSKWREASNYIANSMLNVAFSQRLSIAHGCTATAAAMGEFYQSLKVAGYQIHLLLCVSPDQNRLNAIQHRAMHQGFVQTVPEDVIQKGRAFWDNFSIYLKWADTIDFYWVPDFSQQATIVAAYSKSDGLVVLHDDFCKIEALYIENLENNSKLFEWEQIFRMN